MFNCKGWVTFSKIFSNLLYEIERNLENKNELYEIYRAQGAMNYLKELWDSIFLLSSDETEEGEKNE